jgi:hypothetical protein
VLGRSLAPGSTVLVDHREGDEEVNLQVIEPVDVPDAPPVDLVPAEGPAEPEDAPEGDAGDEPTDD